MLAVELGGALPGAGLPWPWSACSWLIAGFLEASKEAPWVFGPGKGS